MNRLKTCLLVAIFAVICIVLTGCGEEKAEVNNQNNDNLSGELTEIMEKVYAGVNQEMPALANTELTAENLQYYLGVTELDFKEGLASEPLMSSIAHSVVLVRVNDGVDIEKTKQDIKNNVDPRKWLCVGVEEKDVLVASRGDLIILIMVNDYSQEFLNSFNSL